MEEDYRELLYVLSHDLRGPLTNIRSFADMIAEKNLDDDVRDYLAFILSATGKLEGYVSSLLSLSRISTYEFNIRSIDPMELIEKLINKEGYLKGKVRVLKLPRVMVDSLQFNVLIKELVDNAFKFNKSMSPSVEISGEKKGEYSIIRIKDNGIGIKEEHFERIFCLFQRLHTDSEYPGFGFGLAFSKKLCEKMNGKIWIESKVNEGSAVCLRFKSG